MQETVQSKSSVTAGVDQKKCTVKYIFKLKRQETTQDENKPPLLKWRLICLTFSEMQETTYLIWMVVSKCEPFLRVYKLPTEKHFQKATSKRLMT